ncbi:hypothetical protein [Phenylobacterium sp.]|uniref:hypothetical protein n=1 Tax=Phenylobacterium sp. TaxID=1871053 RepID=UPI0027333BF8|nr:hypothetical protein [Phenylobacterium sp.]MDP3855080.1 hypothetical protein [Phenylobacterium sp.]
MEELSRLHKDVPFGWAALLQDFLAERRARRLAGSPWGPRPETLSVPGDLHHLAGPH